jgi:hypothetical protein
VDATVATVAADVGEPVEAIRPAVELIARLLSEARDLDSAMASLRADGEAGAHAGLLTERLLDRYLSTLWAMWELREQEPWDRAVLVHLARRLLHAGDVIVAAVASGYRAVDRELVARDVEARRAFLEELLGAVGLDAAGAGRMRRHALARGLDPDGWFRLVAVAAEGSDEAFDDAVGRLGTGLGILSAGERARTGLTLPQVIGWRGRIVVLARGDWPGLPRLHTALDAVLGDRPPAGTSRLAIREEDASQTDGEAGAPWTAVVGPVVTGVEALAPALHALIDTLRTAERLGHRGWLDHPNELAVERLMFIDDELLGEVVHHELGPIMADARMGAELVETLDVYFEVGENMRETARRLHLANRTVAYRLERIETLLGGPLDGTRRERLVVALMARRLLNADQVTPAGQATANLSAADGAPTRP